MKSRFLRNWYTLSYVGIALSTQDHPSILKIYEVFEEPEFEYIVTEYCEGKELFDIIIDRHYFP